MTKAKASKMIFYSIRYDSSQSPDWQITETHSLELAKLELPQSEKEQHWPILIAFPEQKIAMRTPNMKKVITGTLEEFKDWAEVYELLLTQLTATGYKVTNEVFDYSKFESFEEFIASKV